MTSHHLRLMQLLFAYDPIKPRDAFYGGRTEAIGLYREAAPEKGEQLKYVDFNSLYPFINKYARYPVKHPVVVRGEDIPEEVEGLVKCLVLPPTKLFLPVLPWRNGEGKLLFPLCRSCGESGQTDGCTHTSPVLRQGPHRHLDVARAIQGGGVRIQDLAEDRSLSLSQHLAIRPRDAHRGDMGGVHQQVGQVEAGSVGLPQRV